MSSPVRIKKSRTEIADTIRRAHYKACWGIEPLASWRSITTAYQQQIWLSCADAVISAIESDRREVHESGAPMEPNGD